MAHFQDAIAALLAFALLPNAHALLAQQRMSSAPQSPNFSGLWVELRPKSGPPMRLKLTPTWSGVEVRPSYRDSFSDRAYGVASIETGKATWAEHVSCIAQYRSPGYDYADPGVSTYTLSFGQPTDGGEPTLIYIQEVQWNAPCGGHPIGTEHIRKILTRK